MNVPTIVALENDHVRSRVVATNSTPIIPTARTTNDCCDSCCAAGSRPGPGCNIASFRSESFFCETVSAVAPALLPCVSRADGIVVASRAACRDGCAFVGDVGVVGDAVCPAVEAEETESSCRGSELCPFAGIPLVDADERVPCPRRPPPFPPPIPTSVRRGGCRGTGRCT